ncbi:MAG: M20/M25/M40 family metallo-hydrolase [Pseudoxanthomonas sp.]
MLKRDVLKQSVAALCLGLCSVVQVQAQTKEPVDLDMVSRIRQEAFHNSQAMNLLGQLTEQIGPRLTNSPAMAQANAWSRGKFGEWGLANIHDEAFDDFGRGWAWKSASVELLAPRITSLHVVPKAWTPGTNGTVEGEAILLNLKTKADLEKYKGKLKGKIVLLSEARDYKPGEEPDSKRYDEAGLEELLEYQLPKDSNPAERKKRLGEFAQRQELTKATNEFLVEEGVLAALSISGWDNGILRVGGGGSRRAGESAGVPELAVAAEHYNPLVRAVQRDETVKLRVNVDAGFTTDSNDPGYNTIAEIPGSGKADEVVMIGAHMDSWHAGTGASDNGAGVVVMMEAMRILKAVGAKPKRTIRIGLWSGEEQGLIGSAAYVKKHFAAYPEPADPEQKKIPEFFRESKGQLQKSKGYDKFAAYFNLDNGSGKIRGVYAQENQAVMPIFAAWLAPFNDVGATIVTGRNTGSTDHISFDRVGLPGFQFVQDGLDYFSNVHHSDLDTYDHASADDLKQAAAIIASFAYHAAMREQKLPRKRLLEK